MKAKEKKFQEKTTKLYRGGVIAILALKCTVLLIAAISILVFSYSAEHTMLVNSLIDTGFCISCLLLGANFKELLIRTEK